MNIIEHLKTLDKVRNLPAVYVCNSTGYKIYKGGVLVGDVMSQRHKIRLAIGICGSVEKDGKVYWYYGYGGQRGPLKGFWEKVYYKVLRKLSPLLTKIL